MTGADSIRKTLADALAADPSVVVLGEALELSPATRGLLADHPERVHLLPASDASITGLAVGMAMGGKRPVVELAEPESLWGALQHLGQEAATLADRGEFRAPIILRVPVGPEGWDPTPLIESISGLNIAVVGRPERAGATLQAALQAGDPTVILEPRSVLAARFEGPAEPAFGKAEVLREGQHATVLALGDYVAAALQAAEALSDEGISVEVVDIGWVRPLDVATITTSVSKTGRPIVAGEAASVLSTATQQGFLRLESPPAAATEGLADTIRNSVHF